MQVFRVISFFGAFLVGVWLPLRIIGFVPSQTLEIVFDLITSVISGINIHLFFEYQKELDEKAVDIRKRIGLLFDVLCMFPKSLIVFYFLGSGFGWILLINFLSIRHIREIKPFLDEFDSLQPMTYRLVPLFLTVPLLVHVISCGWIYLGSGTIGNDPDLVLTYVRAVYWTFTTLTTVGYGDISAKSIPQMLYAANVQVIGVGVFGFILSNVASLLSRSDAAREHHMDNLDKVETFMRMHHIGPDLRQKIRAYYHYLWVSKKGYRDKALIDNLPIKIQSELFYSINQAIIERVPFLQAASRELLHDLMRQLHPRIFIPAERVFRKGEKGDALYLIQKGTVKILDENNTLLATLGEGQFFGEGALISDKPRSATVIADTFCDVYYLTKESFDRVTKTYPEFKTHMEEVMKSRRAS